MGSVKSFFLRNLFPSSVEMVVLDVLYILIIYLWTKRYNCCIKSSNYVKLAYLPLLCLSLAWIERPLKLIFFLSIWMHFVWYYIYSIKYLISRKEKKFSSQKTRIMDTVPSLHGIQMGENGKKKWKLASFIFLSSKISADCDCSHVIKRCLLLEEKLWQT